jgi:hypothetical protein
MVAGYRMALCKQALFVHEAEAGLPLEVLGTQVLQLVALAGVAGLHLAQHLLQGTGSMGLVDGVIEAGHQAPACEQPLLAAGERHGGDRPVEKLLRKMPGHRVGRLVDVVVTIEQAHSSWRNHGRGYNPAPTRVWP